jgi:transposase
MALRPQILPPVPEATAAAVHAAFPKGNLYVDLRAEFGALYDDQLFADLYSLQGRPVEVAPWRLALDLVMQYIEGLTDRQAADAVRRCMDWKYALSLGLTDSGFDLTLLHDFRCRLLTEEAGQPFLDTLDTFLAACKARGWVKVRGTQRTDSTHVLAAIRTLHCLECVLEAMHWALNQLSDVASAWVSNTCCWNGIPATASGPTRRACRRMPANAKRSPARLVRMAINSWSGSASQRARQASGISQP